MKKKLMTFIVVLMVGTVTFGQSTHFSSWLDAFKAEALAEGIRPQILKEAFQQVQPSSKVRHFDQSQPEKRLAFLKYRQTRADNYRIMLAKKKYKKHQAIIDQVAQDYGVDRCYILTFWGMESSYGHFMGNFPVIQSLATLAYSGRRTDFFREELKYALKMLNENHVSLSTLKGEWAGASGQPQFLPSSWYHYAVDYNQDGKKDIWKSYPDIFASIANYLKSHGWVSEQPWGVEVKLPKHFDSSVINDKNSFKSVDQWRNLGVQFHSSYRIDPTWQARIIYPDGGPSMMIFNNFEVIMRWNRSTYYAGTIGYMADQVCQMLPQT
jgi:membrane-bound lytic murein transglycosylase B